jgi:adenylyltransferase/sulfurtransferase
MDTEPARPLADAAARTRYARHLLLPEIGVVGQGRLAAARVLVLGAGGLGSPALLYLAAAGVGTLGIADDDVVELTNLQRQIVHGTADLGQPKVESAAAAIARLNPSVRVEIHRDRVTAQTADRLVAAYDVVVDGSDNFPTRYAVNDACVRAGVPLVWASVLRFDAQVAVWWAGRGPCLRCVFPRPPAAGEVPSCAEAGVLGALCGTIGSVQAIEALKIVLGIGEPLVGRLLVHDALRQSWDSLAVQADPGCAACGTAGAGEQGTQEQGAQGVPEQGAGESLAGVREGGIPGGDGEPVATVTARMLAAELRGPHPPVLVDVRPAPERSIVSIPGAIAIDLADFRSGEAFSRPELGEKGTPLVLYCKTGARSEEATRLVGAAGWRYAANLTGGVLAWVRDIDPGLASY